ncbi:hypothetical protein L1987_85276 [Smallanthus sonchifolius]|uniref:Uncharacterized protein n=1 Tax=Smallanthus sonchifolius TaxID=185202 RepID=A0ACB8XVG3_9ASTR|nr:hypothetical protein L1987_85276 [Smallanthus sonchifolius]
MIQLYRFLWKDNSFKRRALRYLLCARPNKNDPVSNGKGTKRKITSSHAVLERLVEWLVFRKVDHAAKSKAHILQPLAYAKLEFSTLLASLG